MVYISVACRIVYHSLLKSADASDIASFFPSLMRCILHDENDNVVSRYALLEAVSLVLHEYQTILVF